MEKQINPSFLVVGAAKSGTTSLFHYLNQHPNIYIPKVKECRFFSQLPKNFKGLGAEFFPNSGITNPKKYFELFEDHKFKVCGEISTDYLYYYKRSIKNIQKYLGNEVKIIVVLRNPIDRAYSNYVHSLRYGWEDLSFEQALIEEPYRINHNWAWSYHYVKTGFYYNQVKAYMDNFNKIKVFLFDEFKNLNKLMEEIFYFLELSLIDKNNNFEIYNKSGYPRIRFIQNFNSNNYDFLYHFKPILRNIVLKKLLKKIREKNLKRIQISYKTKLYLSEIYSKEIKNLSKLLEKDLTYWITH